MVCEAVLAAVDALPAVAAKSADVAGLRATIENRAAELGWELAPAG